MTLTSETLVVLAGTVLSLVFEYVPGVEKWYGGLDSQQKRIVMAGVVIAVAAALLGLSCANSPYVLTECTPEGSWNLLGLVVMALAANQAVHRLFKKA